MGGKGMPKGVGRNRFLNPCFLGCGFNYGKDHSAAIKQEGDQLFFGSVDGWVEILELQLEGKKRMSADAFLKGYDLTNAILLID